MIDQRLCEAAGLTGAAGDEFRQVCLALYPDYRASARMARREDHFRAGDLLDEMIKSEGPLDAKTLNEFASILQREVVRAPISFIDHWYLVHMVWQASCLARARSDDAAQALLRERFDATAEKTEDRHVARWLREATRIEGPAPRFAAIRREPPPGYKRKSPADVMPPPPN